MASQRGMDRGAVRTRIWLSLLLAALVLATSASLSTAAPYLRFERGVHAVRSYAAGICAKRCSSWSISRCRRFTARNVGCRFLGHVPGEGPCRAGINAFLLPEKPSGAILGVTGSFTTKRCPAELGNPAANHG